MNDDALSRQETTLLVAVRDGSVRANGLSDHQRRVLANLERRGLLKMSARPYLTKTGHDVARSADGQ